jgi:RNA polymerase sigma factor (sigma-70 family)
MALRLPREVAQEAVQDVAVLALRRLYQPNFLSKEEDFARWAFSRLRWLALDAHITKARRAHYVLLPIETAERLLWRQPAQEASAILNLVLERGIKELPDRQKAVFFHVLSGRSTHEIAARLGISEATVRSLLRFARLRLVDLLGVSNEDKDRIEERNGKRASSPR